MEKKEKITNGGDMCTECAGHTGMYHGCRGQYHWVYMIVRIVIVIFVFWCGVQFGELKGMIRSQMLAPHVGWQSTYHPTTSNIRYTIDPSTAPVEDMQSTSSLQ